MSKHRAQPLVRTQWLIDLLDQYNITTNEICDELNINTSVRQSALHTLSLPDYLKLLNWASVKLNDPHFGLTTAHYIQASDFGPALYMSFNSANLRELFTSLEKIDTQISQGLNIHFQEGAVMSQIDYRIIMPTQEEGRHDVEQSIAILTQLIRRYTYKDWLPHRIDFTHGKPANMDRLIEEFGDNIHFEQAHNSLIFESHVLDTLITDADPNLLKILQQQIELSLNKLKGHDNLISKIHYLLVLSISSGEADSENIAKQLHMSRRSLVRHLAAQGTSFKLMKDNVTEELAKTALTETDSNISQIALQLGFSETSAFDRTFKKLTGYTPRTYRQRALSL